MRLVKIGLGNVNTTVGAFHANVDRALALATTMAENHVTLGVFQEQLVGGYPSEDLVQWPSFVDKQWLELLRFAKATKDFCPVFVLGVTVACEGLPYNCAAVIAHGQILGLVPKEKLPMYGVFYEARTMARGWPGQLKTCHDVPLGDCIFAFDFGCFAVDVCEDLWSPEGPLRRRTYAGAEIVVNISASPYRIGVVETRRELIATRAADHQCTLVYVNAVGGNDGLIFDGGGYVNQNGRLLGEAPRFREAYTDVTVDLDRTTHLRIENTTWRSDLEIAANLLVKPHVIKSTYHGWTRHKNNLGYPLPKHHSFFLPDSETKPSMRTTFCEDIINALALGLGDYFTKSQGFQCLGIALSGGRDSALTLLIAQRFLQQNKRDPGLLHAFYMTTQHSSAATRKAAMALARAVGCRFSEVSLQDAYEREIEATKKMLGPDRDISDITQQNIQARLRAERMWNWANTMNGLYLQTGNMSEKAVGYTTVGGDLTGALSVIANVPKTVVTYLLEYLYEQTQNEGIRLVLAHPPSPELADNQIGEEELMPFPILDACFHLFAGEKLSKADVTLVIDKMFPDVSPAQHQEYVDKFVHRFMTSIYKWVQAPISLHIGNLDLERERALQIPVITAWDGC